MSSIADPDKIDALLDQAEAALTQGQTAQAEAALQEVLRLDERQFDALHLLGVIALQRQDHSTCIDLIGQALAVDAEVAMAHANLGVAWLETRRPEQALLAFEQAIALERDYVQAHFGRGAALIALEQWEAAIEALGQGLAQQPGNAEGHSQQGHAWLMLQRFGDALASYERVLALQPQHAIAWINRGHACVGLNRATDALDCYERAISLLPDSAAAWGGRGDACQALQRHEEAVAHYDRSLALQPDQARVIGNRASALQKLRRFDESISGYERALQLTPDDTTLLSNLGGALREAQRWEEALDRCERALQIDPNHVGANMNRGNALLDMGQLEQARAAFEKASALKPEDVDAQWIRGWSALLAGDWGAGLPQLEWRWKRGVYVNAKPRVFAQPLWLGQLDLRGRTILLHAEQGLGDTLQFCRYVPMVAAMGARVVLEVQPALKSLMRSLAGVSQVVAHGEPLPPFDAHCPLMSLPLAFKTTPDTVPAPGAYLSAAPALVQAWSERLGARTRPRVGLIWSGNAAHSNDHNRSMPLATLMSAMPGGLDLVCLQRDIRDSDVPTLKAHPELRRLPEALQTFDDAAALTQSMDLVISVDTSMAHLAGALGKPTWILLSRMPDWRWLMDRSDSPWYPSARLFRQTAWGRWDEPLQALRLALEQLKA